MRRLATTVSLNETERAELHAIATDNGRHQREQISAKVLLRVGELQASNSTFLLTDIASEIGTTTENVSKILRSYRAGGCDYALDWAGTAKKRTTTSQAMMETLADLLKEPAPQRSKHGKWTQQILSEELNSRGFPCSPSSVRQAMIILRARGAPRHPP